MKKILSCIVFTASLSLPFLAFSQRIPVNENTIRGTRSFIHPEINRIQNAGSLDSFYKKLTQLKTTQKGIVSIVHIGDSHTQADFLTAVVRDGLQQFFGNAGRGLVFPYQLAQSNAPPDISSSSNVSWQFNRIAHPESPIVPGISGYTIQTGADGATIDFLLRPGAAGAQTFDRLKFFVGPADSINWAFQPGNNEQFIPFKKDKDSSVYLEIGLPEGISSFSLSSSPALTKEFYGVSLENSKPGILYHVIGVNGARYDQYNIASLFWKQLEALKADLFIISLGTNEAQRDLFNEKDFWQQLSVFLQKLKVAAPGAAVLVTTSADSFKNRRPNKVLKQLNLSIAGYCRQNHIAAWDLYRVTGGYGSAYSWMKKGWMNRDRIHFTAGGYQIQGSLLFNALAKEYNNYLKNITN